MSPAIQLKLAQSHKGRIILHLITLRKDRKFLWHFQGIMREFKKVVK